MYSPGSSRDSPLGFYDDEFDEYPVYYPDEGPYAHDNFVHSVEFVRRESSESSLELEKRFEEEQPEKKLLPLKELCCRFVGQNFPFGVVQLYPSRVPEDVQRRVAFWSFPTDEKKLLDYAKVMGGATENDIQCARRTKVTGMVQSGMYLTGTVSQPHNLDYYRGYSREKESFRAYVQFDRGCITATKCSCGEQNWCRHVLALCLARLDESVPLQLHPPISETLTNLDRDQLQKLVQYFLEKLPLEGVAAVQEIVSNLLDKGSEINQTPGAPDLTAGGCPGDKPVWQMDKNVIIRKLNSAYETKLDKRYRGYYECTSALQEYTATLVGFKEFTSDSNSGTPSDLHTLLLYEDDNLSIALKWAIEKLLTEIPKKMHQYVYSQRDSMTNDQKWIEWCFCRMLLPVMQIFFTSPAISSSAKEDVTECLAQCLQQDLPSPIVELLNCFKQIATSGVLADTNGCHLLLTCLQQTLLKGIQHDSNTGVIAVSDPALLHCAVAVVQYMDFYNRGRAPEMEDVIVTICGFLFSANLTDAASLQELVAIRVDHGLQGVSLPLLLEYGTTLLHYTSNPDLAAELVFKLMGNQLPVSNCSNQVLVHHNWAMKAMITSVDEAEIFTKACCDVKSKLAGLTIKWLQENCLALESCPNLTAVLTGMWNMMRLVCRCGTGDCLKVVKLMTQELIGLLSSTLPISNSAHGREGADSEESNLPVDIMADSFTGLLVDLFTMLPTVDGQELFGTLHKAYPTPVDAKRSLEMSRYGYNDWQQCLLDGATVLSQTQNATFFPSKPPMEGFECQLEEAIQRYSYAGRYHQANAALTSQDDSEQAEILQVCRTQCSVSDSHVSFLKQLHKCLLEAHAPLQLQMQFLVDQVSNCLHYNWARRGRGHAYYEYRRGNRGHGRDQSVLACNEIGAFLQVLNDMWKYSISPENAIDLLESVQDDATPQVSDVMCDILISVLDCEASLHLRIFKLISKISLKPQHILNAVSVVSYNMSGEAQSSDECRTTFIRCAETLGKAYKQYKDSGTAEEALLPCRVKAVGLLHQARSIPVARSTHQLEFMYQSSGVDVSSVMHVVCDSGQDALTDLLALMVMLPGPLLLQSLETLNEVCKYYFKDSYLSNSLQVPPFKDPVMALLEKRMNEIKTFAGSHGESGTMREFIDDLKACFQLLGDEATFNTFQQDLAAVVQNADKQVYRHVYRQLPWGMVYDGDDDEEDVQPLAFASLQRMLQLAHAGRDMSYFW